MVPPDFLYFQRAKFSLFPGGTFCMAFLLWFPVLPAMQEETSRENVQRLIFQLDEASSFSARNAIVEKLKELGGNALPILERPPKGIRQQTGQILLKIRNDIEKRLSTEEVAATKVTLTGSYSPRSAIQSLETQSGNRFRFPTDFQSNLNSEFQINNVDFWQALDIVLDRFQLTVPSLTAGKTIPITARDPANIKRIQAATYCGIIRAEPQWIQSFVDLTNPKLRTDRLLIRFTWEPRLEPYEVWVNYRDFTAKASKLPLKIAKDNRLKINVVGGRNHIDLEVPFANLERSESTIDAVSGILNLEVPTGRNRFSFDLATKSRPLQRKGDMLVAVSNIKRIQEHVDISMDFSITEAGESLSSHQGWMFRSLAYVVDNDGNKFKPTKTVTTQQDATSMGFTFSFPISKQLSGFKFFYETPSALRSVPVPFEIRDISLR
ncbi:hypothetical protein OAF71_01005 [bacterium]|nr:hypothetical protein [bacterium]